MFTVTKTDEYEKWFRGLRDHNAKARINIRIRRLETGNPGDSEPVGEGVSEMRIDVGPGYRVYFVREGGEVYVLLVGGDKSSQKRDIRTALAMARQLRQEQRL